MVIISYVMQLRLVIDTTIIFNDGDENAVDWLYDVIFPLL